MTRTTKLLSAAAMGLSLIALAGPANAQFGPMGGGMGPMGMGMRGSMMGMRGMGMMPGMGSARYMALDGQGSRRSRSREVYEEPPRQVRARKVAPVIAHAPRMTTPVAAPAMQAVHVQPNVTTTAKQITAVQPQQATLPAPQTVPAQPQVQAQPPVQAQPQQNPVPVASVSTIASASVDSALPTRITAETRPHNCMTKLHLKDGTVILQDFCTLEQAVIKQADAPRPQTQPASQSVPIAAPQQAPAQLARTR